MTRLFVNAYPDAWPRGSDGPTARKSTIGLRTALSLPSAASVRRLQRFQVGLLPRGRLAPRSHPLQRARDQWPVLEGRRGSRVVARWVYPDVVRIAAALRTPWATRHVRRSRRRCGSGCDNAAGPLPVLSCAMGMDGHVEARSPTVGHVAAIAADLPTLRLRPARSALTFQGVDGRR